MLGNLVLRLSPNATCKNQLCRSGSSVGGGGVGPKLQMKNRNPMNLERMRIGFKPTGFPCERRNRSYWNSLDLFITSQHTTATVTHWTGRKVCSASTKEWAIRKFLYNYTDVAALKCVGAIIGQRCLETGVSEVFLQITAAEEKAKERMGTFVRSIRQAGLILEEPQQYKPYNPHQKLWASVHEDTPISVRPWEVPE